MFLKTNFLTYCLVICQLISVLNSQKFSKDWTAKKIKPKFLEPRNLVQYTYPQTSPFANCYSIYFNFQIIDKDLILNNMIAFEGSDSYNYILKTTKYPGVFLIDGLSLDNFFIIIHKLNKWGGIILISYDDSEYPQFSQILSALIFSNNRVARALNKFQIACYLGQRDFQEYSLNCPFPGPGKSNDFEPKNSTILLLIRKLTKI